MITVSQRKEDLLELTKSQLRTLAFNLKIAQYDETIKHDENWLIDRITQYELTRGEIAPDWVREQERTQSVLDTEAGIRQIRMLTELRDGMIHEINHQFEQRILSLRRAFNLDSKMELIDRSVDPSMNRSFKYDLIDPLQGLKKKPQFAPRAPGVPFKKRAPKRQK